MFTFSKKGAKRPFFESLKTTCGNGGHKTSKFRLC